MYARPYCTRTRLHVHCACRASGPAGWAGRVGRGGCPPGTQTAARPAGTSRMRGKAAASAQTSPTWPQNVEQLLLNNLRSGAHGNCTPRPAGTAARCAQGQAPRGHGARPAPSHGDDKSPEIICLYSGNNICNLKDARLVRNVAGRGTDLAARSFLGVRCAPHANAGGQRDATRRADAANERDEKAETDY